MIILVRKGLWKLPAAQVLWMIRTCRSWITPEHERAISRKLRQNSLQKSLGFPRSLKVLSLLVSLWFCIYHIGFMGWSCKNCSYFSKFPLRLMHLSPDRIHFWQADLLIFSNLWCVSFGFLRSVTNAAKRLPECVVCKKNTRQRCPSSLRTDRLLPVSHEWPMAQSLSQKWPYDVSVKRQQWHAMTTSNDSVTRLSRLIDCLL